MTLSPERQNRFEIRIVNITTLSTNEQEFGSLFLQCLFEDWIGFDTVVNNWIVDQFEGIGYVYSQEMKRILDLKATRRFHFFAAFSSKKGLNISQKINENKRSNDNKFYSVGNKRDVTNDIERAIAEEINSIPTNSKVRFFKKFVKLFKKFVFISNRNTYFLPLL